MVALVTAGDPDRLTGGFLYQRRIAALAPAHGARVVVVCFPERRFPLAALDAPRVLRQARVSGAQVVVLDSLAAAYLGPWLALRRPTLPVVGLLHQPPGGLEGRWIRRTVQRALDRLAYRGTAQLIAASDTLRDRMVRAGWPSERFVVVQPGRDVVAAPARIAPNRHTPHALRAGRSIAALCVASWLPHKGVLELLEALARLPDALVTLHLAGDEQADPEYAALVCQRVERGDLAGRVVRHAALPPEQIATLYTGADVFVLPSYKETYGTVYGEAMALGLPVIGWRAANLPHLVEHEREGLLAAPGDVTELAGALERLARDKALRMRMGAAAHERASAWPTWDDSAAAFFSALREVVARTEKQ